MNRGSEEATEENDDVYEPDRAFADAGRYSDLALTGAELVEAFRDGATWWVGRGGGFAGSRFRDDIASGRWTSQMYEVCTDAESPPSPNYFSLMEFVDAISHPIRG